MPGGRARFCQLHSAQANICVIVGCEQLAIEGKRTCSDPIHQAVEATHLERSGAAFQLKNRIQRAQVAHPNDSNPVYSADLVALTEEEVNDEEEFEEQNGGVFPGEEFSGLIPSNAEPLTPQRKLRAQFGRKRTHNEQLIVAPCGVIMRSTGWLMEGKARMLREIDLRGLVDWLKENALMDWKGCSADWRRVSNGMWMMLDTCV